MYCILHEHELCFSESVRTRSLDSY